MSSGERTPSKVLMLYSDGNYPLCIRVLKQLIAQPKLQEQPIVCSIIENNLLVSECLQTWDQDGENATEWWKEVSQRFSTIQWNMNEKSLEELSPKLNATHNFLFWNWISPLGSVGESLELARKCFHFVLYVFTDKCISNITGDTCNDEKQALVLVMKATLSHLFDSIGMHTVQLLEIYLLVLHMILESTPCNTGQNLKLLQSCANFIKTLTNQRDQFEVSARVWQSEGFGRVKVHQFKFGLKRLNSTVYTPDLDSVFTALGTLECLCLMELKQYKSSLSSLGMPCLSSDMSLVSYYLKSYIYFLLEEYEISQLFLNQLMKLTLRTDLKTCCHILKGAILSKQNKFSAAQNEFHTAWKLQPSNPLPAYHAARNTEKLLTEHQCSSNNTKNKLNIQACCSKTSEAYLDAINALIALAKSENVVGDVSYTSLYERKILNIVQPSRTFLLKEALYMLATKSYNDGNVEKSARTFMKFLEVHFHNKNIEAHFESTCQTVSLHISIAIHETIAVLVQNKELDHAEITCRMALESLGDGGTQIQELILNLLLSIIQGLSGDGEQCATIDKCIKVLTKKYAISENPYNDTKPDTSLLTKLSAKVYLQKALLMAEEQNINDAKRLFEQAISCNPSDKDVRYNYVMLLMKIGDPNQYAEWVTAMDAFDVADASYSNIALRYLLGPQVTTDKLETMSIYFLTCDNFEDL